MTTSTVDPPREEQPSAPRRRRARGVLSVVLLVLATVAAVVGGAALYVRQEIVNTDAFVDRANDALQQPNTQAVVSREVAVQLVEPALPDVVAARPVVQTAVKLAIGSEPFRAAFRLAARHGHRLLFDRNGGNAVFDIADAGAVVSSALRTLAPKIAQKIPSKVDAVLLKLRKRSFAGTTLRVADHVRVLGIILPVVAVLLYGLAIGIAPVRRRAITRSAVAVGLGALVLVVVLELVRRYVTGHIVVSTELTKSAAQGAVGEIFGAYFDDLITWALGFLAVACLLAASSSAMLAPYSATELLHRGRALAVRPRSPRLRGAVGAVALVLGVFVVVKPTLALRIVAIAGGVFLVYYAMGELLTVTAPETPRVQRQFRLRLSRRRTLTFGAAAAAAVAAVVAGIVLTGASPSQASAKGTCNGYAALCNRRLDEVAFPGTHNAMSAADSPGWFIANQDRPIAQQLEDGMRAFKISTHYGTEGNKGLVHTDILAAGDKLNRVAEKLVPAARAALERFSRGLGGTPRGAGKRDIWLCHTLCELGATRMVTFFDTIRRFLEANPNNVIILFNEDYVSEQDLEAAFKRAGVFKYLATLQPGQPLPTLGQLISQHHNIVVFAQEHTSGKYPWDPYAFDWMQDTPLGAKTTNEFTCKLYRGKAGNPLLLMNNWSDIFPPRPQPNVPLVQRDFLLKRSQQCVQQRGRLPNLILTDFYNRGDVAGAANVLNGVAGKKPAALKPFKPEDT
jgi:hypothetical protein